MKAYLISSALFLSVLAQSQISTSDFVTTWKTDNPGTLGNNSSIYLTANAAANYDVDWNNDGIFDTIGVTGNISHQYPSPGIYTIRIRGDFPSVFFGGYMPSQWGPGDIRDSRKLISVDQWGTIPFKSLQNAFRLCENMNIIATDTLSLDSLSNTSLAQMFFGCSSLNSNLNGWDVSNVTDMSLMFYKAGKYNQPMDNWDVSNVTDMSYMFHNAFNLNQNFGAWPITAVTNMYSAFNFTNLSVENYDSTLIAWEAKPHQSNVDCGWQYNMEYCAGEIARDSLMADGWFFFGDQLNCHPEDFVSGWQTNLPGTSNDSALTIYTDTAYSYNYDIDWENDGIYDTLGAMGNVFHQYAAPGVYNVRIRGNFPSIKFGQGDRGKLVGISQWGRIPFQSLEYAFDSCYSLNVIYGKSINLDSTTSLNYTFKNVGDPSFFSFVELGGWDVSTIQSMQGLFENGGFGWPGINYWDVSNVTTMKSMFKNSVFSSFGNGTLPNPPNHWDVSSVTDMSEMFSGANSFNQDISSWDVSNVTDMSAMFDSATSFNQPLNNWDVSKVTDMSGMFHNATIFNQPLDNWNVQHVTTMIAMFLNASSFDQNLGSWDIWIVSHMQHMLNNSGLSVANYDRTLIGWETGLRQPFVALGADSLAFCLGKAARDSLIAGGWNIVGDTLAASCTTNPLNDFVTTWQTGILNLGNAADSMVFIPTKSGYNYNYNVDWDNDGVFDTLGVTASINHKYNSQGLKTVRISGQYPALAFNSLHMGGGLISVDQWGKQVWKNMESGFGDCLHLQSVGMDAPILDSVLSLKDLFAYTSSFNSNINHWDVSNITDMKRMFQFAKLFNQDLSSWDVSNVADMSIMFNGAESFNQDLGGWNVSNVTNMGGMFLNAKAFNQNLGGWDISSVQATAVPLINGMWAMLDSTNMSTANYDSTILGWNNNPHYPNIGLGSADLTYCISKDARDSLMTDGWIFYGDTLDPNCSATSVLENQIEQQINVYPNPNSGSFTIQFSKEPFSGELKIYGMSGQLVYQREVENKEQIELDLNLVQGLYILRMTSPNLDFEEKIILQ